MPRSPADSPAAGQPSRSAAVPGWRQQPRRYPCSRGYGGQTAREVGSRGRLLGFAHRVYGAKDPRARVLSQLCQERGAPRYEVALERGAEPPRRGRLGRDRVPLIS
ncbi:MAG: citrate/2-methylcitrate synthase [Pseudonocardiaceae bacterium]